MSGARIFLGFSILIWLPYGLYCFFVPESLTLNAGVEGLSGTATTELRAMYGGLQAAIGALALFGFVRRDVEPTALLAIGFLAAGLCSTRFLGALMDGDFSAYTGGALVFEALSAGFGLGLWRREQRVSV